MKAVEQFEQQIALFVTNPDDQATQQTVLSQTLGLVNSHPEERAAIFTSLITHLGKIPKAQGCPNWYYFVFSLSEPLVQNLAELTSLLKVLFNISENETNANDINEFTKNIFKKININNDFQTHLANKNLTDIYANNISKILFLDLKIPVRVLQKLVAYAEESVSLQQMQQIMALQQYNVNIYAELLKYDPLKQQKLYKQWPLWISLSWQELEVLLYTVVESHSLEYAWTFTSEVFYTLIARFQSDMDHAAKVKLLKFFLANFRLDLQNEHLSELGIDFDEIKTEFLEAMAIGRIYKTYFVDSQNYNNDSDLAENLSIPELVATIKKLGSNPSLSRALKKKISAAAQHGSVIAQLLNETILDLYLFTFENMPEIYQKIESWQHKYQQAYDKAKETLGAEHQISILFSHVLHRTVDIKNIAAQMLGVASCAFYYIDTNRCEKLISQNAALNDKIFVSLVEILASGASYESLSILHKYFKLCTDPAAFECLLKISATADAPSFPVCVILTELSVGNEELQSIAIQEIIPKLNIINQNKTFQVIEVLDYITMLYKAYENPSQMLQHSYFYLILQLCLNTNFINNFKKCQDPSNDYGFTASEALFNMLRYFIRENTDSGKDIVQQGLEIIFSDNVTSLLIQMTQHPYYQQTNSLNETLEDLSDHLSELKILQALMQGQNKRTFLPALQLVTFKLQDSEIKFCIEEILSKMGVDFKDDHIIEQFLDLGFKLQENTELRSQQKLNLLAACLANPKIEVTKPYANKPDDINPIISAAIANCGPNVITCIPFTENGQPKAIISIPKQIGRKNLILTADEQNSSILAAATSRQKFIQFLHVDNTNAKPAKRDKYLLNVKNKLDALGLYPKSSSMLRSNLSYALILLTLETKQFNHALEQLSSKTIEQIAFAAMQTSLGFFTSQRQIQFFIRNIIMQRDSAALFSYGVSLSRAPANIASEAYPRFKSFIQSVCSPNAVEFYNHRYDIKGNQHLQALNNLSTVFFMAWQQRYSLPLEKVYDIFKLQNATKQIDIRKFLFNVVVNHKHLPQTQPFDMVYSYFTDNDNHSRALIRRNLKNLLKDTTSQQHKEHKYVQAIIYLYELDKTDKNNKLRLIQCALSQRIHYELNNDLMALFRSLASNDYSMQNIDLGKYTEGSPQKSCLNLSLARHQRPISHLWGNSTFSFCPMLYNLPTQTK